MKPRRRKPRFVNWHPIVGEKALVPGNPGNAQYIDALNEHDIIAIMDGHRGYTPLYITVKSQDGQFSERISYHKDRWSTVHGMLHKTLSRSLRALAEYYGVKMNVLEAFNTQHHE